MEASESHIRPPRATGPGGWIERLRPRRSRGTTESSTERKTVVPVGIVTDSAAALPDAWMAKHQRFVRMVPMPVMVNDQIFSEGSDDVPTELALGLAMGQAVRTSRPAPGTLLRAYRELAEAGVSEIISIHLSSKLSGTVEAARLAAASAPVPVRVVDSLTVALAQGFAVMATAERAAAGASADELEALAQSAADNHVYFAVPSLEQLRKGGRIGTVASMLGTLLNVKPILSMRDGQIIAYEKVRTQSRTVARLVAIARAEAQARGPAVQMAVHYFGNLEAAEEIVQELAGASQFEVLAVPVPAVLGAHTGVGVLAVAIAGGQAPPVPKPVRAEPKTRAEPRPKPEPRPKNGARQRAEARKDSRHPGPVPPADPTP